jgi:hypothetical protein
MHGGLGANQFPGRVTKTADGNKSKFCNYLREQLIVTLCVLIISYHVTLFMIPLLHHLDPESERVRAQQGSQAGSIHQPISKQPLHGHFPHPRPAIAAKNTATSRFGDTRIADAVDGRVH